MMSLETWKKLKYNSKILLILKLKLKTDFGTYNIGYSSHEDFPTIPVVSRDKEVVIGGTDLKRAIDQTSFAMSKEDMRPAMTGMLFEFSSDGLRFVTTDGHRLVKICL